MQGSIAATVAAAPCKVRCARLAPLLLLLLGASGGCAGALRKQHPSRRRIGGSAPASRRRRLSRRHSGPSWAAVAANYASAHDSAPSIHTSGRPAQLAGRFVRPDAAAAAANIRQAAAEHRCPEPGTPHTSHTKSRRCRRHHTLLLEQLLPEA